MADWAENVDTQATNGGFLVQRRLQFKPQILHKRPQPMNFDCSLIGTWLAGNVDPSEQVPQAVG